MCVECCEDDFVVIDCGVVVDDVVVWYDVIG